VDAVIVHDAKSQEHYHDIVKPEKFAVLPLIYDSKQGDYVYRVPRRWASLARVVDAARLRSLSPVNEIYPETLQAYLDLVEKGPDETATLQWTGTDSMRIQGRTAPGQWIIAQSSYDGSWHAYENGKRLRTRPDPIGFLAIETAAGDHDIQVVFETPLENRAGQVLTALSLVMVGALLVRGRRGPA
jgi:hypothetical protein